MVDTVKSGIGSQQIRNFCRTGQAASEHRCHRRWPVRIGNIYRPCPPSVSGTGVVQVPVCYEISCDFTLISNPANVYHGNQRRGLYAYGYFRSAGSDLHRIEPHVRSVRCWILPGPLMPVRNNSSMSSFPNSGSARLTYEPMRGATTEMHLLKEFPQAHIPGKRHQQWSSFGNLTGGIQLQRRCTMEQFMASVAESWILWRSRFIYPLSRTYTLTEDLSVLELRSA